MKSLNKLILLWLGTVMSTGLNAAPDAATLQLLAEKTRELQELNAKINAELAQDAEQKTLTTNSGLVTDVKIVDGQNYQITTPSTPIPEVKPTSPHRVTTTNTYVPRSYNERVQLRLQQLSDKLSAVNKLLAADTSPDVYQSTIAKERLRTNKNVHNASDNNITTNMNASLLNTDPCYQTFVQNTDNSEIICQDTFIDKRPGPELAVIRPLSRGQKLFAVTKYPISIREYSVYCNITGACVHLPEQYMPASKPITKTDKEVGLNLVDVADTVEDYNAYCAYTGKCPGIYTLDQEAPVTNITFLEAQAYAYWLSEQTGFRYRIVNDNEWLYALGMSQPMVCKQIYSAATRYHLDNNQGIANRWGVVSYLLANKREWVLINDKIAARGPYRNKNSEQCEVEREFYDETYRDPQIGFRLAREIQ